MSDPYACVQKGSLKIKGVAESGIKKKKKKRKAAKEAPEVPPADGYTAHRTEAERHFMERQRQREAERILKKASKTHKEKVEEFNRNLDAQSEHYDIPKVSWTK